MQGLAYLEIDDCPICSTHLDPTRLNSRDIFDIKCSRCGNFNITNEATDILHRNRLNNLQIANASGWIRENQGVTITSSDSDIEALRNLRTPTVAEKANKLLLYLSKSYPKPGQAIPYDIDKSKSREEHLSFLSITWAQDFEEFGYLFLVYLLQEKRFLIRDSENNIIIGSEGWAYIDSLTQINPESQIAFVAMWISDEVKPLWTESIKPGIENAGYEPLRIDMHQHNNRIDDEIIAMIRRSKFLIADFTGQRGGVYFEAGFALGMGLPVIWVCRENELKDVHFDTRQYNFVTWQDEKLDDLKKVLQYRVEATLGRGKYKPPKT